MAETVHLPPDLSSFLEGQWHIDRLAEDRLADAAYRMEGDGEFSPDGSDLAYAESVTWWVDDRLLNGGRAYRYHFPAPQAAPLHADVLFADGSLFHTLDLDGGTCEVAHDCPPDRYDGLYHLIDGDHFRVRWTVVGPKKDVVLSTLYSRTG